MAAATVGANAADLFELPLRIGQARMRFGDLCLGGAEQQTAQLGHARVVRRRVVCARGCGAHVLRRVFCDVFRVHELRPAGRSVVAGDFELVG